MGLTKGLSQSLFDFNYWARDRQLDACAALSTDQLLRPLGNSHDSLRDTLVHLMAVEWLWLERWRGAANVSLLPASEFPTLDAIATRWHDVEQQMRAYVQGIAEEALRQEFAYNKLNGAPCSYPLWQQWMHLLNHQSYHRGQVTTLLRQLGAKAPGVDFLIACDDGLFA